MDGRPYLHMFDQWNGDTARELLPDFAFSATVDWLALLEEGLRSIGRPELTTLTLAVIRGLLMDLDATDDAVRTHRAFRDFRVLLERP
ncbi:MAG: hypothetical protein HYZ38_28300 [Mycobacterium sp.]|nr:hypothetical protein [Mycobacterium sp.]